MPYHSDILGDMAKKTYPLPGSRAALVYDYIAANPGTTKNGVITALGFNASVVKKCVVSLLTNGRIVDKPDEKGYHHYRVKTRV